MLQPGFSQLFLKVTFFLVLHHRGELKSAKAFPNLSFKVNALQVFSF